MRPIAILGAGLAGLSLAAALGEAGAREPIVVIDRRTRFDADRTWCTWATEPLRFGELARHRWARWETRRNGERVVQESARHPYLHLDARDVYATGLERLAAAGAELRLGERVVSVDAEGRRPQVRTIRETFEAAWVIDALGPRSPLLRGRPPGEVELAQRFLGWEVETERPAFDPTTATLMDFLPGDDDGLNFLYVLPFASTRALVEHTSIGFGGPPPPARRAAIRAELARRGAADYELVREERGLIAMTSFRFPAAHGPRVWSAGAAGGAVRPSSGYAFSRIQRQASALARALLAGAPAPPPLAPAPLARLDRIFLTALAGRADAGEALLWRIAERVSGDAFARFMTDVPRPADLTRLIAALPPGAMGRAALRTPARR